MGSEILGCPLEAFLADYCPFLPNNTLVDAAIQALVHQQLLIVTNKHCKRLSWKNEPSSAAMAGENFKPLEAVAGILDNELGQLDGHQRHFFYHDRPNEYIKSEITGSNFGTYACFTGNPNHAQNKRVLRAETAVIAEFKKSATACEDDMPHTRSRSSLQNYEKLVSAANHILNDDPC
ncbi:hypothetical protein AGABI1DRAFT_132596 [Agaricus bisporus var. burnettii JB137-S8]|uniref:Uncharacterized protein n=1 Tax=Agaricus bisporus var. burnettii (strain JB137-S8 / ATCC MYA-4627 / FGSC 10392) TaxID=597362 RepID=K5WWA0_AGABU|nr:uncharacterized protein AGABI1DRAFT_132596 [Agaricus bisporus var. burnettii JB137-S8]EKM75058.1 hypothetical protein AGABI1DRAFT_132596 [Agaricus bisporus var. burnettii JB137-S8]